MKTHLPLALIAAFIALAQQVTGPTAMALQQTAPATTTASAGEGAAVVTVTAVEGNARARSGPGADWQSVVEGMKLPVGAEITTGPRARVTCLIPPGEQFVVDRMSTVTVLEAERRGNRQRTRLMMRYGRTAARVEAAGVEHDMQIRTPVTTASVKGTDYTIYDQPPFAPELRTNAGLVDYRFAKRQLLVGKGGTSRGGRASAETALVESVVDPSTARVRTEADAALIANETSRGAVVNYNPTIQLDEIRGGAGPQTDADLVNSLPGKLNFVIRWKQNVDVDIFVTVQPGDQLQTILAGTFNPQTFLYPGFGQQTSPTGGRIPYNHRGGANGGQEVCFWPDSFPTAVYGFSAINNSSGNPVDVRFNAYLDGQKISLYSFGLDGTLIRTKGLLRTLDPSGTQSAIVLAPPNELFESILPESPDETVSGQVSAGVSAKDQAKAARAARASAKAAAKAAKASPKPSKPSRTVSAPKPVRAR